MESGSDRIELVGPVQRVLMTTDTVGGAWSPAIDLARGLSKRGVKTVLAAMGAAARDSQRAEAAAIPGLTLLDSPFKSEWMDDPWEDVALAGEWLLRLEKAHRPDVVHLAGYAHAALEWKAPTVLTCHGCVVSWWQAIGGSDAAPPAVEKYRQAARNGVTAATHVVSPTNAMLQSVIRNYGTPKSASVIPNGSQSGDHFIAEKEPFVLATGRMWDEARNLTVLEDVVPKIPWPLMVAGDEPEHDSNLTSLGKLDRAEMLDWYARASVYVLPAKYEPYGHSVLEAALSGCALVLGDIGTMREIWDGAALFVEPDQPAQIQAIIASLCSDPESRRRLGEKAHYRAMQFSADIMAKRYLELYNRLVISRSKADLPAPVPNAEVL